MNLEKLSSLPASVLTDITNTPEQSKPSPEPGNPGTSERELFSTADHAKQDHSSPFPDNPSLPAQPITPAATGSKLGDVVGGKTVTDLVDILFPSLCVWAVASIGYKVPKGKLQMTAKEKEVLAPAMQNYLNSINVNFDNPLYNLMFVLGSIYASKVIDILPELEKVKTVKKEPGKVVEMGKVKSEDDIVKEIYMKRKKSKADAREYYLKHKNIFDNAPNVSEAIDYIKEQEKK